MRFLVPIAFLSAVCVGVCLGPNKAPKAPETDVEAAEQTNNCQRAHITMNGTPVCENGWMCIGQNTPPVKGWCKLLKLPMPLGRNVYCCE